MQPKHLAGSPRNEPPIVTKFGGRFARRADRLFPRFRRIPLLRNTLRMGVRGSELIGVRRNVTDPTKYGGEFAPTETILEIHVYPKLGKNGKPDRQSLRDMAMLITEFGRVIPNLREMGIVGFVGHTPTKSIGEKFEAYYDMRRIATTAEVEHEVRAHMAREIRRSGFPPGLLSEPIISIVKRI